MADAGREYSKGQARQEARMSCPTCPHFQDCSAPICPEDPESLANCAWFPGEEICRREVYASLPWVRKQRRTALATGKDAERGCFTVEMLAHDCRVYGTVQGLDPETEITVARSQKWIREHPEITETRRAQLRAQGQKNVAAYGGIGPKKVPSGPSSEGSTPEMVKSHGDTL
jgi:hypothetical protein